ncbi:thioredoxin family protein [Thalassospira lucentensis]|uniref:Redox-active disulfide protein 2 n=1 Tax=Thalassospira lucentensis TaxID=168935 RepID=A0A358HPL6_9PROT|nr:thioredoxin family protein [Thalassospira lucentensis]HBU97129.1 redox-active disulfide protein 2 [Thalassospira lucentensis]HCW65737.1 redox-active disulfide protein 2 [Thalassospira lucentensis]|tara:strand:- start:386 stop:616 length:231 start_codon:yes stop_codon:yes gene_type:complete
MKLTIYGSGCAKCQTLAKNAEAAAQSLDLEYDLEKVTDTNSIIDARIMRTPALMADDKILVEGKVPTPDEIRLMLS